jgi:hypothetical protein
MNKTIIFYFVGILVLLLGGVFLMQPKESTVSGQTTDKSPREQCVEHAPSLSMHIHPELEIYVDDEKQVIPENVGIKENCMMALHTHDETGKIHVEFPQVRDFTLGDFMANWGQPITRDGYNMAMTVDGVENTEGENLILKDLQKIALRYTKSSE